MNQISTPSPLNTIVLLMLTAFLFSCRPALPETAAGHPLEECPDTPNCTRTQTELAVAPEEALNRAEAALEQMGAESIELENERIHAVFRIPVFGWRDDVHIAVVERGESDSVVFIRSASRTGRSDLGVNARRVNRFFNQLEQTQ